MGYRGTRKGSYTQQKHGVSHSFGRKKPQRLVDLWEGWRDNPNEFRMHVRQGAIPDNVWNNKDLQEYLEPGRGIFGYVGSFQRSIASDKILMEEMKNAKVRSDQIAKFLMSSDGRHIADYLPDKEMFRKQLTQYLNHYH